MLAVLLLHCLLRIPLFLIINTGGKRCQPKCAGNAVLAGEVKVISPGCNS